MPREGGRQQQHGVVSFYFKQALTNFLKCKMNKYQFTNHHISNSLWNQHPQFKQYCKYYDEMKTWFQVYKASLLNLREQETNQRINGYESFVEPSLGYVPASSQYGNDPVWSWRNQTVDTEQSTCNEYSSVDQSDDDSIVMEITDEMMAFLETSEKHRQSLKLQREEEEEKSKSGRFTGKYTTVRNAFTGCLQESCLPPRDRPGVERTAEMKLLYGDNAAKIHGMETSMQLTFDHNCDLHQPKLWPNIPLKL